MPRMRLYFCDSFGGRDSQANERNRRAIETALRYQVRCDLVTPSLRPSHITIFDVPVLEVDHESVQYEGLSNIENFLKDYQAQSAMMETRPALSVPTKIIRHSESSEVQKRPAFTPSIPRAIMTKISVFLRLF
jgi:hypothetical protein